MATAYDGRLQEMFHGTTCFFFELWTDFQREPVSKDQGVIDMLMEDSGIPPNWGPWYALALHPSISSLTWKQESCRSCMNHSCGGTASVNIFIETGGGVSQSAHA